LRNGDTGADRIIGSSGDDILIAGTTVYDRVDAALLDDLDAAQLTSSSESKKTQSGPLLDVVTNLDPTEDVINNQPAPGPFAYRLSVCNPLNG